MEFLILVSSMCRMLSCIIFFWYCFNFFSLSQKILVVCFLEKCYIWNRVTPAWLEAGDWQLASSFADKHLGAWADSKLSMGQQHFQTEKRPSVSWAVWTGAQPVVGGQWLLPALERVTLHLLLSFHPSQFQEHIDRQEEGWVKATGMARPEVLLWWEAEEMGLLPGKGKGRPNGYRPISVGQSLSYTALGNRRSSASWEECLTAREQETLSEVTRGDFIWIEGKFFLLGGQGGSGADNPERLCMPCLWGFCGMTEQSLEQPDLTWSLTLFWARGQTTDLLRYLPSQMIL